MPVILGIMAALFFAVTFVLNHRMAEAETSWLFQSSMRFLWMLPLMTVITMITGEFHKVIMHMRQRWLQWLLWSTVAFVLFYAPLCFAASFSPGWVISGTWQLTIICGMLTAPLFTRRLTDGTVIRQRVPLRGLLISCIILIGIMLIQFVDFQWNSFVISFGVVLFAAISYPLGNRKMMEVTDGEISAIGRVFGMTLVTTPIWLLLFASGVALYGFPTAHAYSQTLIVAVFSGVIATVLFFKATDLVRRHPEQLAAVEATQAMEVVFALLLEMMLFGIDPPNIYGWIGIVIIVGGIVLHSYSDKLAVKQRKFK